MDKKKKAQLAWAVLLALLGLLFVPSLPGGNNSGGSESPAEDPAPEESGEETQQGSEDGADDGAEDGTEDTTGDGAEDGWSVEDGEDDQAGQDEDPLQEPTWGDDETQDPDGTGSDGGPVEDRQDQFPDENEENAEHNEELFPPDATEGETTYGDEPTVEIESVEDLREYAASSGDPQIGAPDEGVANQPFHDSGTGLFEWARENPGQAALVVGGVAAPFAASAYLAAGGTTLALSASQAASLAAVGVPASTYESASQNLKDTLADEVDGIGGTGDVTEPSGGQDTIEGSRGTGQDGAVEEPDDSTSEPWSDDGADGGDDSQDGRGGPDGGEGDLTPDIDPIDIPDELQDDDSGDDSGDDGSTVDDDWSPDDGGHSPGPGIDPDDPSTAPSASPPSSGDDSDEGSDSDDEPPLWDDPLAPVTGPGGVYP